MTKVYFPGIQGLSRLHFSILLGTFMAIFISTLTLLHKFLPNEQKMSQATLRSAVEASTKGHVATRTKGNLNILNKKINLKSVSTDDNYKASNEDLIYFKNTFENILFDKSFLDIFDLKKIKGFILELS